MIFSHPSSRPVASGRMPLRVELLEDRVVPTHSPLGPEFPVGLLVPQQSTVSVGRTAVAMDAEGDFVVAWAESQFNFASASQDITIFARRYDSNGTAVTSAIVVAQFSAETNSVVDVAMDQDGDFVVVYDRDPPDSTNRGDVFFRRFAFDGSAKDANSIQVDISVADAALLPSVSMDSAGNFVVAFTDNGSFGEVYFRRYNADGAALGNPILASTDAFAFGGSTVDVASDGVGNFVIVWDAVDSSAESSLIAGRRYDLNGNPLDTSPFQVNETDLQTSFSSVSVGRARDTSAFVVVWTEEFFIPDAEFSGIRIKARQFQADGSSQPEFQVDQPMALDPEAGITRSVAISSARPDVAIDAHGDFAIVYQSKVIVPLFAPPGDVFVGPNSTDPTFVSRVLLRTFKADGSEDDPQQFASSQSSSKFPGPVVASDDCGDLVLAWHGDDFGPGFVGDIGTDSILARLYRTSDICEEPGTPEIPPEIPPVVIDPRDPAQAIVLTQRVELLLAPFLLELSPPTLFSVPTTLPVPERFNPPLSQNVGGSLTIGEIRGRVWDDLNGNGMQDSDEKGVPGQLVFLDTNGNGKLDENEPFTTTDENGDYVFSNLPFGEFQVWQDLRSRRYRQTMPERNEPHIARLSPTQPIVVNLNFGTKDVRAPVMAPNSKNTRDMVPRKEKGKEESAEPSKAKSPPREQSAESPPPQTRRE